MSRFISIRKREIRFKEKGNKYKEKEIYKYKEIRVLNTVVTAE